MRRFIDGENVCVICYEQYDGTKQNIISCTKCGEGCCVKCIYNMLKTELDKFEKVDIWRVVKKKPYWKVFKRPYNEVRKVRG